MNNKFSKGDYSKIELSNLELEIIIQALGNPDFRLMFPRGQVSDTLEICMDHQKDIRKSR